MAPVFPEFLPILTTYAARISGRTLSETRASAATLARALLDSQRVVGNDGILCLFDPMTLVDACIGAGTEGSRLRAPEMVPGCSPIATILSAVGVMRPQLPRDVRVYASFAGPALLLQELSARTGNADEVDIDYVGDVFLATVRAAFDARAHGIAVIEQPLAEIPPPIAALYRSANKLADFYEGLQMVFHLPGVTTSAATEAHCSFFLESDRDCGQLLQGVGRTEARMPFTSAADVTPDTPIQRLREMRELARGMPSASRSGPDGHAENA